MQIESEKHNINKENNPTRKSNNCKCLCSQHGSTQIDKETWKNIKEEINSNVIIVGDFDALLTTMAMSTRQKINKKTVVWNDTLDKMYLTNIFRPFHIKTEEYTFFSNEYGHSPE